MYGELIGGEGVEVCVAGCMLGVYSEALIRTSIGLLYEFHRGSFCCVVFLQFASYRAALGESQIRCEYPPYFSYIPFRLS